MKPGTFLYDDRGFYLIVSFDKNDTLEVVYLGNIIEQLNDMVKRTWSFEGAMREIDHGSLFYLEEK